MDSPATRAMASQKLAKMRQNSERTVTPLNGNTHQA
jgi:hypothetical protein